MLLDNCKVLISDSIHIREVFHDLSLAKNSFFLSHGDVGVDFLLRCQDSCSLILPALLSLLKLLCEANNGRASQVEIIVTAQGNSEEL